jgi:hypothetical protein
MKTLVQSELAQFSGGSDEFYKHPLHARIRYTAGARYIFQAGEAYWLLDEIAFANGFSKPVKAEEFQVWKLTVDGSRGELTCEDGNGNEILSKHITYTDFPLPEITLWCCDNTILLPCEY